MDWQDNFAGRKHTFVDQSTNSRAIAVDLANLSTAFISGLTIGTLFAPMPAPAGTLQFGDLRWKAIILYNTPGISVAELHIPAPVFNIFFALTLERVNPAAIVALTAACIGVLLSDLEAQAQSFRDGYSLYRPRQNAWEINSGLLKNRTYLWWADRFGHNCYTNMVHLGDGATIRADILPHSNAQLVEYMEGPFDDAGIYAGLSGTYQTLTDQAWLYYEDSRGNIVKVVLPAPIDSVFRTDGRSVSPGGVNTVTADMLAIGLSRQGNPITRFVRGHRVHAEIALPYA